MIVLNLQFHFWRIPSSTHWLIASDQLTPPALPGRICHHHHPEDCSWLLVSLLQILQVLQSDTFGSLVWILGHTVTSNWLAGADQLETLVKFWPVYHKFCRFFSLRLLDNWFKILGYTVTSNWLVATDQLSPPVSPGKIHHCYRPI